jgi:hypothetical protein
MNNLKIALSGVLIMAFIACGKENIGPTITISSPAEGSTLAKGKQNTIEGKVTDDTGLSEINVGNLKITSFDSPTSHSLNNIIFTIPDTTKSTQGSLIFSAKDVDGLTSSKTVTFKIQ